MFRNKSVSVHEFAMVPRADIPRSQFKMQKGVKTTFNAGFLVPVLVEEVLPGDSFNCRMTVFARLATPLFPFMDNMHLDSFFFFVPNRLVWTNWVKFMGEQTNPGDSISFTIPQVVSPVGGWAVGTLYDQMGIPTVGQIDAAQQIGINALPLRAYNLIYNQWFRDQNLQSSGAVPTGDGPDAESSYVLQRRFKRHDYFTSALPFVQKGAAVALPLTGNATVRTNATDLVSGASQNLRWLTTAGAAAAANVMVGTGVAGQQTVTTGTAITGPNVSIVPSNMYADLSTATATTINALRQAFQIQRLLERDARGGTRYTEIVRSHFGVTSPDARLQRPEYLGGGTQRVSVNPIAQTSATGLTGATTPLANLSAFGTVLAQGHGFSQAFTEHGYIIGIVNVRADLTYQQGTRRMWSRLTRYDFFFPVFSMLGEQAIFNKEIYTRGDANDNLVFGYQERWAEYRYNPSEIRGLMRSTAAGTQDAWHLAQRFSALPTLNATFMQENPPVDRILAVPTAPHFLADFFFDMKVARPMPMYSVPGMIDHF